MTTDRIHKDFAELITKPSIHKRLGISSAKAADIRYKLKSNRTVSLERKLKLLQQSGWHQVDASFTHEDMIRFAKFVLNSGGSAKDLGVPYLLDKWKNAYGK